MVIICIMFKSSKLYAYHVKLFSEDAIRQMYVVCYYQFTFTFKWYELFLCIIIHFSRRYFFIGTSWKFLWYVSKTFSIYIIAFAIFRVWYCFDWWKIVLGMISKLILPWNTKSVVPTYKKHKCLDGSFDHFCQIWCCWFFCFFCE